MVKVSGEGESNAWGMIIQVVEEKDALIESMQKREIELLQKIFDAEQKIKSLIKQLSTYEITKQERTEER